MVATTETNGNMEAKLDRIIEGQTLLQNSFVSMSKQQLLLTKSVDELSKKLEDTKVKFEEDVHLLKKKNIDIEKSLEFAHNQYEETKKTNDDLIERVVNK